MHLLLQQAIQLRKHRYIIFTAGIPLTEEKILSMAFLKARFENLKIFMFPPRAERNLKAETGTIFQCRC